MRIEAGDYVTVEQYRRRCGYASRTTILRAIKQGRLNAIKFDRTYLIPAAAVLLTPRTGLHVGEYAKNMESRQRTLAEIAKAGYTPEQIFGKRK